MKISAFEAVYFIFACSFLKMDNMHGCDDEETIRKKFDFKPRVHLCLDLLEGLSNGEMVDEWKAELSKQVRETLKMIENAYTYVQSLGRINTSEQEMAALATEAMKESKEGEDSRNICNSIMAALETAKISIGRETEEGTAATRKV